MKKLKELRQMLTYPDVRNSLILRKLIVVSLCEIYKDIMPSYKIRPLTEKEKEQNVLILNLNYFTNLKAISLFLLNQGW